MITVLESRINDLIDADIPAVLHEWRCQVARISSAVKHDRLTDQEAEVERQAIRDKAEKALAFIRDL